MSAQDVHELIKAIELAQSPGCGGGDDYTLPELMEKLRVPGLSIAVISDFKVQWHKEYGMADTLSRTPVSAGTRFQAGSISKPVAVMAALRLVQEGKLSLDADVTRYLRSWSLKGTRAADWAPITIRAIASHTAGFGDGHGFPGYPPGDPLPTTVQILNGEPPANTGPVLVQGPPNSGMRYSGGGLTVLQLIVAEVTGRPFKEYAEDAVLRPLGMERSSFAQPLPENRADAAASGHNERGLSMGPKWYVYPELAAAGLWTTPSDLARFISEVQLSIQGNSNLVLCPELSREMASPVGVGDFGVGFMVERKGHGWYFHHGGVNVGFVGFMIGHKSKGYGAAIMTNAQSGGALIEEVRSRIERTHCWDTLWRPQLR